jgi:FixJ family two-component response regulator
MNETDAMVFVVDDDAPLRESLKNLIRSVHRTPRSADKLGAGVAGRLHRLALAI